GVVFWMRSILADELLHLPDKPPGVGECIRGFPMSVAGDTARRKRPWLWYFVVLGILSVTAASIQFWYAKGRVLTLDKVLAAEEKWKAHGPASYDLKYTTRKGEVTDEYQVEVRKGKVVSLTCNGKPVEERLYRYSTMPALLSFIEDFMRQD